MKSQFILLFAFLSCNCFGQYTLTIKSIKDCDMFTISDKQNPAETGIQKTDIKPDTNVKIVFEETIKVKSINFNYKDDEIVLNMEVPANRLANQEFNLVKVGERKMQWESVGEILYPYEIFFEDINGNTCKLVLGQNLLEEKIEITKITTDINVLDGIDVIQSNARYDDSVCKKMGNCNALLLLDCSPFLSSNSQLYKKKSEDNCKPKRFLKVGDYLKVYLYNFNKYRYKVEVNNTFVDAEYGESELILTTSGEPTSDEGDTTDAPEGITEASSKSEDDEKIIQKIIDMSVAQMQLKAFINRTKNSTTPDSRQLDANKEKIIENMDAVGLIPIDSNLKEEFGKLNREVRDKYNVEFEKASALESTFNEFHLLSYTIEATILPIRIKSFDKFNLTVTLKDAKTGNQINSQDYTYLIAGGFKVDQSFGINLHGIKDRQFSLRPFMENDTVFAMKSNGERLQVILANGEVKDSIASISSGVRNEIIEADTSNFKTIGLTTLTHFYYRLSGAFSIGPEVGVSADIFPKTDVRYLMGLGFLFKDGRYRISLDLGFAFGKYQDFGAQQDFGSILKGQGVNPTLIEKSASKPYIGISYNIPLNNDNASTQKAKL